MLNTSPSLFLVYCIFVLVYVDLCNCQVQVDRTSRATYQKIYEDLHHLSGCFKRFNGTHSIGCSTPDSGTVGALHYINKTEDLSWFVSKSAEIKYVCVLEPAMFHSSTIRSLKSTGKVVGILVLSRNSSTNQPPEEFSSDYSCPNGESGLYDGCTDDWNPSGDGLFYDDFTDFPISVITDADESEKVLQCFLSYNRPEGGPDGDPAVGRLCAAEMRAYMYGASDSQTCMRRSAVRNNLQSRTYCSPMGAQNVHMSLNAGRVPQSGRDDGVRCSQPKADGVIALAARLDSFSMFENLVPGANSVISGVVTLLGVAEALKRHQDRLETANKDLWFMFFEGEAFDYIGSSRMVYDMKEGVFPQDCVGQSKGNHSLTLTDLHFFLELSQVGLAKSKKYYLHSKDNGAITHEVVGKLQDEASVEGVNMESMGVDQELPVASSQRFIKERTDLPHLIIADYNRTYMNKYYNSRWDTGEAIDHTYPDGLNSTQQYNHVTPLAKNLASLATAVARAVYDLTGAQEANVTADEKYITRLLYCFLVSPDCDLFHTVVPPRLNKILEGGTPFSTYVGVFDPTNTNKVAFMVKNLLSYTFGKTNPNITTAGDCKGLWQTWMSGEINGTERTNVCVESSSLYHAAQSPVFVGDTATTYDWASGEYPTWTESIWEINSFTLRIFLIPRRSLEVGTLVGGIVIFISCLVTGWFLKKKFGDTLGKV